jgi:hypothetical protein
MCMPDATRTRCDMQALAARSHGAMGVQGIECERGGLPCVAGVVLQNKVENVRRLFAVKVDGQAGAAIGVEPAGRGTAWLTGCLYAYRPTFPQQRFNQICICPAHVNLNGAHADSHRGGQSAPALHPPRAPRWWWWGGRGRRGQQLPSTPKKRGIATPGLALRLRPCPPPPPPPHTHALEGRLQRTILVLHGPLWPHAWPWQAPAALVVLSSLHPPVEQQAAGLQVRVQLDDLGAVVVLLHPNLPEQRGFKRSSAHRVSVTRSTLRDARGTTRQAQPLAPRGGTVQTHVASAHLHFGSIPENQLLADHNVALSNRLAHDPGCLPPGSTTWAHTTTPLSSL